jgi:hypothetical protein
VQIIDPTIMSLDRSTESIVFAANGDFYIGHATGATRRIQKYNSSGVFQQAYEVAVENVGSDWLDLAADQQTIFYTSEGSLIKRYNVATGSQLSDFANIGGRSFALRLLPSGGLLVANETSIKRLNSSGSIVQTYDASNQDNWFALNLDPGGSSFWSADLVTGNFYRFNIATGAIEIGPVNASPYGVDGLCVKGEVTSGQPTPTGSPTNTPTSTNTLTPTPVCVVPTRTTFPWGCSTLPTATSSPFPPQIVKSYYIEPTRTPGPLSTATPIGWHGTWWEGGYAAAVDAIANGGPQYGLAILDFGGPYWIISNGSEEPDSREWGTISIRTDTYYPLDEIENIAGEFATGFYKRSSQQFPIESRPHITVTLGTSNYWFPNSSHPLSVGDFRQHGQRWGRMVAYLNLLYTNYRPLVQFEGATDIEFDWSDPEHALSWAQGYEEVTRPIDSASRSYHYYSYSSCNGCYDDPSDDPNITEIDQVHPDSPPDHDILFTWPIDEIVGVNSANRAALPLPQIYYPSTAHPTYANQSVQWHWLSSYAATHYICLGQYDVPRGIPGAMPFQGVTADGSYANLQPDQAWGKFWRELTGTSCTLPSYDIMLNLTPIWYHPYVP